MQVKGMRATLPTPICLACHPSTVPLFCRPPRTCLLLRIISGKGAENPSQTGALAQIDHAALYYPCCQQPFPSTYHFTPLTISSSARPFFAPVAGVSWNNGGGSQVGRCLSIHLTRQSSHLPLSEGFIMRGGPRRALSKGRKDGKEYLLKKGLQQLRSSKRWAENNFSNPQKLGRVIRTIYLDDLIMISY